MEGISSAYTFRNPLTQLVSLPYIVSDCARAWKVIARLTKEAEAISSRRDCFAIARNDRVASVLVLPSQIRGLFGLAQIPKFSSY